jgi:ferredoxin
LRNLETAARVLDAAGLGRDRIQLVTSKDGAAKPEPAWDALDAIAAGWKPSPVRFEAERYRPAGNHELVADALRVFLTQLGPQPDPIALPKEAPYARAEVRAAGCTLCRSCANVCPTHAFRFDEASQALEFKHVSCVACGLCEAVCPENVITLRRELALTEAALDYQVLVQDVLVSCTRCHKPYINKRALDAIETRVRAAPALAGVFDGSRAGLLRMCPDCRAVAAVLSVQEGWKP